MERFVHVPVKTLAEARRLAEQFEGSYFQTTSKTGKKILGEGNTTTQRTGFIAETIGYHILSRDGFSYIVKIPYDEDLSRPAEIGDIVIMLQDHRFCYENYNPYGVYGEIVDDSGYRGDFDPIEYSVEWANEESAGCYRVGEDIIVVKKRGE